MSWMLATALWTLIMVFLVYAFQWVLSFFPYLMWLFFKFLYYPVELMSQVIYPVSSFVYVVYTWLIYLLVLKFIVDFFNHKN